MTTNRINDTRPYAVQGMTCAHCVTSVPDEAVKAAVAEAGYAVVS